MVEGGSLGWLRGCDAGNTLEAGGPVEADAARARTAWYRKRTRHPARSRCSSSGLPTVCVPPRLVFFRLAHGLLWHIDDRLGHVLGSQQRELGPRDRCGWPCARLLCPFLCRLSSELGWLMIRGLLLLSVLCLAYGMRNEFHTAVTWRERIPPSLSVFLIACQHHARPWNAVSDTWHLVAQPVGLAVMCSWGVGLILSGASLFLALLPCALLCDGRLAGAGGLAGPWLCHRVACGQRRSPDDGRLDPGC